MRELHVVAFRRRFSTVGLATRRSQGTVESPLVHWKRPEFVDERYDKTDGAPKKATSAKKQ